MMTTQIKKIASLVLALLLATSVSAANDKDKENDNNGNHYGQYKKTAVQPTSVPEPATLALVAGGALAAGVTALIRRRKK